jgi:hypothetical protein
MKVDGRKIYEAKPNAPELGPLKLLPGTWSNTGDFKGRGWNLIALPFEQARFRFRLLMNQYNEKLQFSVIDAGVPNRGINGNAIQGDGDQIVVALGYDQMIEQIAVDDFPASDLHGAVPATIHREPGLFLHMTNQTTAGLNIARLGTVPHGDSVLALGRSSEGPAPVFPDMSGLPVGLRPGGDPASPIDPERPGYLDPYKHYRQNPFKGTAAGVPGFDGFEPFDPLNLLRQAAAGLSIARTTELTFDTVAESAGVINIPFVVTQANASELRSTFWIHELTEKDATGAPRLVMQYAQLVMLDFFPRGDGEPGRIRWPHISINTMERATPEVTPVADMVKGGKVY